MPGMRPIVVVYESFVVEIRWKWLRKLGIGTAVGLLRHALAIGAEKARHLLFRRLLFRRFAISLMIRAGLGRVCPKVAIMLA